MTGATCPHELPVWEWRTGHFCRLGSDCRFPDCKGSVTFPMPSKPAEKLPENRSDSPLNSGAAGDFHSKKEGFSYSNWVTNPDFSDSSRPVRVWQTVIPYESKGREYFRYQWGIGGELKETIHIPGGSRSNPVALKRARQVWVGINKQGWTVQQTKDFISPWRSLRAKL